ncbi:MAG: ATP-binding SpoIIE family protein phosphatase [candidate division WOR-3 bacterium]|nr:ATP-binding SpoIIE family protein phosphatase [candidate division WOR-3 bacterium]
MAASVKDADELRIEVEAHIPWVRGIVRRFAESLGFSEKPLTEIELCVTELATNLVVHGAKNGRISFCEVKENDLHGIEILAQDEGPGIRDLSKALQGGTSTAGSLGQGLPSLQRTADEFEIHSNSQGTRVRMRKYLPRAETKDELARKDLIVSVAVRTHPESTICGDGHVIRHDGPRTLLAVIDGLGHGTQARKAAAVAEAYLVANHRKPLQQMPAELHANLRHTRGAVAGIARIDEAAKKLSFIGVGNISARLWLPEEESWVRLISMSGTLGVSLRTPRLFSYPCNKGSIFIIHSDGLKERWELSTDELIRSPTEIARNLMRDNWRRTDDATVMVAK